MTTIIEATIPFGDFKVTKDGEEINGIIGFDFKCKMNEVVNLNFHYGDILKVKSDSLIAKETMYKMTDNYQTVKIKIDGAFSEFVKVYFNNKELIGCQKIKLKTNRFKGNTLEFCIVPEV